MAAYFHAKQKSGFHESKEGAIFQLGVRNVQNLRDMIRHYRKNDMVSALNKAYMEKKINEKIMNPSIKSIIMLYETAIVRVKKVFKESLPLMDPVKKKKMVTALKSKKAYIKNKSKETENRFLQQILALTNEETIAFQKKVID